MLSRITNKHVKILGGVCAGIAYKYEMPVLLVRLICALLAFFPIINILMLIAYAVSWVFLPTVNVSEEDFKEQTRIYKSSKKDNDLISEVKSKEGINYNDLISEVKSKEELDIVKDANIKEKNS